ncbi:LysR family transcriptional regulator substrate-binding protein [Streptomyces sp. FXJ1.4098]|uniref:LysR family transcriptional regulator substrate-binding protein n=1 Tax=Streptomyces sp. NPDC020845 TaxID=3365096 RepID=UPI0029989C80|nr:LysR family transcriptional regulator substrate-binding protein [Streptomyces sp. FXJ1.4098]
MASLSAARARHGGSGLASDAAPGRSVLHLCHWGCHGRANTGDELSAIVELIKAGLGIGLVPDLAKRSIPSASAAWIAVDNPDCRRTLTLYWGTGNHLSAAARGLRSTIIDWDWMPSGPHTPTAITP